MKEGQIIEQGTIRELTSGGGDYEVVVPAVNGLGDWFREKTVAFTSVDGHFHVHLPDRSAANALIDTLRQRNVEIESLTNKRRTLESVFIDRMETQLEEKK